MFAFSQVEPRTNGQVSDMEVPLDRYMHASLEQGQEDSMFSSISKMRELSLADSDPDAKVLAPEEANNRYSLPGLKWDRPVKENVAQILNRRQQAELDRQFFLSQDNHSVAAGLAGMGASMAGSLMNPLDLATLFLPIVGEEGVAAKGANVLGRGLLRGGLISRQALGEMVPAAPRLAESVIQGVGYQAIQEGVNIANRLDEGKGGANTSDLESLGLGALMAGGIHLGIRGAAALLRRFDPATQDAMARKAMDDFVKGEQTDVTSVAKTQADAENPNLDAEIRQHLKDLRQQVLDIARDRKAQSLPSIERENRKILAEAQPTPAAEVERNAVPATPQDPDVTRVVQDAKDLHDQIKDDPRMQQALDETGFTKEELNNVFAELGMEASAGEKKPRKKRAAKVVTPEPPAPEENPIVASPAAPEPGIAEPKVSPHVGSTGPMFDLYDKFREQHNTKGMEAEAKATLAELYRQAKVRLPGQLEGVEKLTLNAGLEKTISALNRAMDEEMPPSSPQIEKAVEAFHGTMTPEEFTKHVKTLGFRVDPRIGESLSKEERIIQGEDYLINLDQTAGRIRATKFLKDGRELEAEYHPDKQAVQFTLVDRKDTSTYGGMIIPVESHALLRKTDPEKYQVLVGALHEPPDLFPGEGPTPEFKPHAVAMRNTKTGEITRGAPGQIHAQLVKDSGEKLIDQQARIARFTRQVNDHYTEAYDILEKWGNEDPDAAILQMEQNPDPLLAKYANRDEEDLSTLGDAVNKFKKQKEMLAQAREREDEIKRGPNLEPGFVNDRGEYMSKEKYQEMIDESIAPYKQGPVTSSIEQAADCILKNVL